MTVLIKCVCEHEFQDAQYGKNIRVYNTNLKGAKCTCCEKQVTDLKGAKK